MWRGTGEVWFSLRSSPSSIKIPCTIGKATIVLFVWLWCWNRWLRLHRLINSFLRTRSGVSFLFFLLQVILPMLFGVFLTIYCAHCHLSIASARHYLLSICLAWTGLQASLVTGLIARLTFCHVRYGYRLSRLHHRYGRASPHFIFRDCSATLRGEG